MSRRSFLSQLAAFPLMAITTRGFATEGAPAQPSSNPKKSLNIMMKSAWGSDDPTKAAFPFLHGLALAEAGHSVQIFLLGEAVGLMRKSEAEAVVPVGWPPLAQTLEKFPPGRSQFLPAALAHAREEWERLTWPTMVQSTAIRRSLWALWSGRTVSLPSSDCCNFASLPKLSISCERLNIQSNRGRGTADE